MYVDTTSNPFVMLAEALIRRGDDMEDIARELATALKTTIVDGLGTNEKQVIEAEIHYLLGWSTDAAHRKPQL